MLPEGNLKAAVAGQPLVLKDELAGKKTSLDEQSFGLNSGKKKFMTFGRMGRQLRRTTWMC